MKWLIQRPIPGLSLGLGLACAMTGGYAVSLYRRGLPASWTAGVTMAAFGIAALWAISAAVATRRGWWIAVAVISAAGAAGLGRFVLPAAALWVLAVPFLRVGQRYPIALLAVAAGFSIWTRSWDVAALLGSFVFLLAVTHPLEPIPRLPVVGALEERRRAAWTALVARFRILPSWLRFGLLVAAVNFALYALFRFVFWAMFAPTAIAPDDGSMAQAWWVGLRFDLRIALVVALPATLLTFIPKAGRPISLVYLLATTAVAIILYVVDFGHYGWLDQRINARVLDELNHAAISAKVMWESYPVVPGLSAMAAALALYAFVVRRTAFAERSIPGAPLPKWGKVGLAPGLAVFLALGIMGRVSYFPLRWSDAYFSTNSFVSSFALNPIHHFFDTMNSAQGGYDVAAVREYYPEVSAYLEVDEPDREKLSFDRRVRPEPRVPGRPNIVVIFLESFAAYKIGCMGNPLNPTPEFDALARESILFRNFYVAAAPTARSIFSTLTGIPDVNPNESATRNPNIVAQHTIVNAFEGYERHYFVGVSGAWGNIRGILCHNIEDLQLHESQISEPYDLFFLERVHRTLAGKRDRPFFAIVQTSGNHSPYTIPDDRRDFQLRSEPVERLREAGFEKVGEEEKAFNSLRFLDYSLGNFMRLARSEPWFENTVFLIFGDHGTASRHGLPDMQSRLVRHQVPCLVYAPKFFAPRVVDGIASSLDILPTAAHIAGVPYLNRTLGRDLLDERRPRYAYIDEGWHHGLLDDEFYLSVEGSRTVLYRYRTDPHTDWSEQLPDVRQRMERMCRGLHETSRYLLFHNRPSR